MVNIQLILSFICFPFFTIEGVQIFKTLTIISFCMFPTFGFLTWYRGPGFISKDNDVTMTELLNNFKEHELCFDCEIIQLPRSYHCNVCRRCVERYDHHCPWVNSCIGIRNHTPFLIFVGFQALYILSVQVLVISYWCSYNGSLGYVTGIYDPRGVIYNTCLDPARTHWTDLCTGAMSQDGFFGG